MRYSLLGPLTVTDRGRPIEVGPRRVRAVLVLLLLRRNEVVHADRFIDAIWGPEPPPTAAKSLQVCVSHLRRAFREAGADPGVLRTVAGGYELDVADDELDIARLSRMLPEVRGAAAAGDAGAAAGRARDALAMWRGPPLADVAFEEFAQPEILRLEEQRLALIEARADALIALGQLGEALDGLEAVVEEHPLRERFRAQLMVALYLSGRQAEALEQYDRLRRRLDDELGLEPSPETRALHVRMLRQDPGLDGGRLLPTPPAGRASPAWAPVAPARETLRPEPEPERRLRAARLLGAAGAVLAGAGILAILQRRGSRTERAPAVAAVTRDAIVGLAPDGRRALVILPLPGRVEDIAAEGSRLWAVTRNPARLVEIDARRRVVTREFPVRGHPLAVATGGGAAWIADPKLGTLTRVEAGAARHTVRYGPTVRRPASAAVAVGAGTVWVSDGGALLRRTDLAGRPLPAVETGTRLDDVVVARGAVWTISSAAARAYRIDPRRGAVLERVGLPGQPAGTPPVPARLAAGPAGLWALSGMPAVLSRLGPRSGRVTSSVRVATGAGARGLAVGRGAVWVGARNGTVVRYDTRSGHGAALRLGRPAARLAVAAGIPWIAGDAGR